VWKEERIFGRVESIAVDAEGDKCRKACKVLAFAFLEFYARMQLVSLQQSSGDWLSRRPRLTQGCSARRMDGWISATEVHRRPWLADWPSLLPSSCKFPCKLRQEYVVT